MRRALLLTVGACASLCMIWLLSVQACKVISVRMAQDQLTGTTVGYVQESGGEVLLPILIPGTDLVAERIVSYEGPFWEDGSGEHVTNVAALLIRNTADRGIDHAEITLEAGAHQFVFWADMIPAGAAVLVAEKGRKEYSVELFTDCSGWVAFTGEDWNSSDVLDIQPVDMGTLKVTNLTDHVLTGIHIYYRNCLKDADILVGGNTFVYCIDRLELGQSMEIRPNIYAFGYSAILRIQQGEWEYNSGNIDRM